MSGSANRFKMLRKQKSENTRRQGAIEVLNSNSELKIVAHVVLYLNGIARQRVLNDVGQAEIVRSPGVCLNLLSSHSGIDKTTTSVYVIKRNLQNESQVSSGIKSTTALHGEDLTLKTIGRKYRTIRLKNYDENIRHFCEKSKARLVTSNPSLKKKPISLNFPLNGVKIRQFFDRPV